MTALPVFSRTKATPMVQPCVHLTYSKVILENFGHGLNYISLENSAEALSPNPTKHSYGWRGNL